MPDLINELPLRRMTKVAAHMMIGSDSGAEAISDLSVIESGHSLPRGRVMMSLRAVGYNDRDLHAVVTSIAEADEGDYISREEQCAISRMMIEKGRFISREEYLASVVP